MTYVMKRKPDFFDDDFFAQFPRLFGHPGQVQEFAKKQMFKVPEIDIKETEDEYQVFCNVPGFKKNEIDIEFHDATLILRGNQKEEKEDKNEEGFLRKERTMSTFERRFKFDEGVDSEKVEAKLEDGVLRVNLHKTQERKPKQITIKD